jgi:hypothetical protein
MSRHNMRRIAVPLLPHIERRQMKLMPWQSHIGRRFRRAQLSELAVAFHVGNWVVLKIEAVAGEPEGTKQRE